MKAKVKETGFYFSTTSTFQLETLGILIPRSVHRLSVDSVDGVFYLQALHTIAGHKLHSTNTPLLVA